MTDDREAPETPETIAAETLTGDVRDAILTRIRTLPDVWAKLPEARQQAEIEAAARLARDLVCRAAEIVYAAGAPSLRMKVAGVGFKKHLAAQLVGLLTDENRHLLADAVGGEVTVVIAGVQDFDGARGEAKAEPDQRELGPPVFDASPSGDRVAEEEGAPKGRRRKKGTAGR